MCELEPIPTPHTHTRTHTYMHAHILENFPNPHLQKLTDKNVKETYTINFLLLKKKTLPIKPTSPNM